jgi:hypothetical protein
MPRQRRLGRFHRGGAVADARDGPNGAAEDRESVEHLGGSSHSGEKAEEEEFCSVAPGPCREQKEGKWGLARALEEEKGGGPIR